MDTAIISASGVRGIVGSSLDAGMLTQFSTAFGTFLTLSPCKSDHDERGRPDLRKTVVVGRDSRMSGEMAYHSVLAGLIGTGCHVIDVGLCPTPTILLMAKELNSHGSVAITASHNPVEWNGLEFSVDSGRLLNRSERQQFMGIYQSKNFRLAGWDQQGAVEIFEGAINSHIEKIMNLSWVNLHSTHRRALKVVIDCGNGAGSVASPRLLKKLGCEVIELNCIPDGNFPRPPEPTPTSLHQLCSVVQSTAADVGLAHDGDADRLIIVSEEGIPLSGEHTFTFAADLILNKHPGDFVGTVSTSLMLDDVANRHRTQFHRTQVGVAFIVEKMRETGAVIGGEGTGGVIFPELQYTTDGLASISAVVQRLADSDRTISALVKSNPHYVMCQKRLESPSEQVSDAVVRLMAQICSKQGDLEMDGASLDLTDGVKRCWGDRWVIVRKSGTEPVLRIFSEAPNLRQAERLCNETLQILRRLLKRVIKTTPTHESYD